ncbi:hypothetical protein ABZ897_58950 [Nonomuraea sp. NPDC046802]|uniref:hypothetical protein n=1 Tax=Nonomuraea sp. NPDC046802 TaxID=3154919 RepID=UPI0033F28BEB
MEHAGKLKDAGMIKDEGENRRITLPRVSAGLVIVLVLSRLGQPQDRTIACASGDLRVVGSSVLMPTMKAIAQDYADACGNARISTEATGSVEGTRAALADGGPRVSTRP